jgi:hypothetical protein
MAAKQPTNKNITSKLILRQYGVEVEVEGSDADEVAETFEKLVSQFEDYKGYRSKK